MPPPLSFRRWGFFVPRIVSQVFDYQRLMAQAPGSLWRNLLTIKGLRQNEI